MSRTSNWKLMRFNKKKLKCKHRVLILVLTFSSSDDASELFCLKLNFCVWFSSSLLSVEILWTFQCHFLTQWINLNQMWHDTKHYKIIQICSNRRPLTNVSEDGSNIFKNAIKRRLIIYISIKNYQFHQNLA